LEKKLILQDFETRTYGKWILAGEHSVLRGGQALVFPLRSRYLDFQYSLKENQNLEIEIPIGYPEEFKLLFWSVFEKACQMKGLGPSQFKGLIQMKANIPIGSGLGASASLCVALARWFELLKIISVAETFHFAKNLEDIFHGESSGVDVAVVLSETGLLFQRQGTGEIFKSTWQPNWYLSHSGHKGITKECVQKVQAWGQENPDAFIRYDNQMKSAVEICTQVLSSKAEPQKLIQALDLAKDCFYNWGLINEALEGHMEKLMSAGAKAVKPTGSGLGGYVLSLWDESEMPQVEAVEFLKATVISE
jgi:mevalonate kinase